MTELQTETIQDKLFRLNINIQFIEDILTLSDNEIIKGKDTAKYPALEHMLQLSIQIIIDVGSSILAEKFHENPPTYADVILALGKRGIITEAFAKKHEEITKFRNKLVHGYGNVDPLKVLEYARLAPEVFRTFGKAFAKHI